MSSADPLPRSTSLDSNEEQPAELDSQLVRGVHSRRLGGDKPPACRAKARDARLYQPRPITVELGSNRSPKAVASVPVDGTREEWLGEDRWWTPQPLRRHYFELVLTDGRCLVVFHDLVEGGWYAQRA